MLHSHQKVEISLEKYMIIIIIFYREGIAQRRYWQTEIKNNMLTNNLVLCH